MTNVPTPADEDQEPTGLRPHALVLSRGAGAMRGLAGAGAGAGAGSTLPLADLPCFPIEPPTAPDWADAGATATHTISTHKYAARILMTLKYQPVIL